MIHPNFIKDLVLLYNICVEKRYYLLVNIISQLRYYTLAWILKHKVIKEQNAIQKEMLLALKDEYTNEPSVPEMVLKYPAPPKPKKVDKLVDISAKNPYNFSITNQKFILDVSVTSRLGKPGKEGTVYLVNMAINDADMGVGVINTYAMKVYRKKKSYAKILEEARFQQIAARCGIAPKVYAIMKESVKLDVDGPAFIMDLAGERVIDRIKKQQGILTPNQQFNLLKSALELDKCGVRQNDPNPLNFMFDTATSDEVIWIDFGFAKKQESNEINNFMSLHAFLYSGLMGVITRKVLKPEGAKILDFWLNKATEQGKKLTKEDIKLISSNRC